MLKSNKKKGIFRTTKNTAGHKTSKQKKGAAVSYRNLKAANFSLNPTIYTRTYSSG
jgi:hypothetical protein